MSFLFPKSLCRFIRQHRRKFIFTGVFVGGVYGIIKLSEYKIKDHFLQQQRRIGEEMKLNKNFEQVQQHCLSISEAMLEDIIREVKKATDTDEITRKLKSGNGDKILLWTELKVMVFCRIVTGLYAVVLTLLVLHVQVSQVAGLMFNSLSKKDEDVVDSRQQEFINIFHNHLMHQGIQNLASYVKKVVAGQVESMPLQAVYSYKDIEITLQSICTSLFKLPANSSLPLPKLLHFAFPAKLSLESWTVVPPAKQDDVEKWTGKTMDILECPDFETVLSQCIGKGISSVSQGIHYALSETLPNSQISEIPLPSRPLAKLLPILNLQLHTICSVQFLQKISNTADLNRFSSNVYESFIFS